jgi:glutathione synthase/RimK-type ligase-like ATP-grasp enzyme
MTRTDFSMDRSGSVFFVEAALTGSGLMHVQWAIDNGIDVWFLTTNPKKYERVLYGEALSELQRRERVIVCETTEGTTVSESLKRACEHVKGRTGVVCVSDRNLVFAGAFAAEIGATYTSVDAIECLRDKRRARALFDELGLPTARWCAPESVDDVAAFADAVNAPIVIKNCRGTGSLDVKLSLTTAQAVQNYRSMSASSRYLNGDLMLEEYLYGPLVSLEALVRNGQCIGLGVTDRQLGPFAKSRTRSR